jgi:hypothetical protein
MSLIPAIVRGDRETVRSLLDADPELAHQPAGSGDLPAEVAMKAGRFLIAASLFRRQAPGFDDLFAPSRLLLKCMYELSHEYYVAGWQTDLETVVWRLVNNLPIDGAPEGMVDIPDGAREDILHLAESSGIWYHFPEGARKPESIPLLEWRGRTTQQ